MNNINKHFCTRNTKDLSQIYSQTKELQKGVQAALEKLSLKYQQTLERVKQCTDTIIESLREWEGRIFDELDTIKDSIVDKVSSKWKDFKEYGRKIRRNYLGDQKNQQISSFPLHQVKQLIQTMEIKLSFLDQVADQYEERCVPFKQKLREEATGNKQIYESHSDKKTIVDNFPQISPIKPNFRQRKLTSAIEGVQLENHLDIKENIALQSPQYLQNEEDPPTRKFKTQLLDEVDHRISRKSRSKLKESRSVKALLFSPEVEQFKQPKSPPISVTRSTSPLLTAFRSIRTIESPKFKEEKMKKFGKMALVGKKHEIGINNDTGLNSTRRDSRNKDSLTNRGYNFCLQRLQRQQKEYERIKRGLQ